MVKPMTYWSISSQVLKEEAEKLGLEVEILVMEKNLFLVKWNGKEVLFKSTDFGVNSALGKKIADDKELTYTLLQKYGIPVPRTLYMKKEEFDDFAWTLLEGFRFPLVVKPIDEAHGTWVCMGILSIEELQKKLQTSFETYPKLIIQEQITGNECRVLVILWEVVVALHRIPPYVTWDGLSSIGQLIESENRNNPLRRNEYNSPLSHIRVDDELIDCVEKQWLTLKSILSAGMKMQLRGNSNLGTGGTLEDITALLDEETKRQCIATAKRMGLWICWVDILTSDFSKPLSETGWVILEVNATPWIGGDRELSSVNSGREILKKIFSI